MYIFKKKKKKKKKKKNNDVKQKVQNVSKTCRYCHHRRKTRLVIHQIQKVFIFFLNEQYEFSTGSSLGQIRLGSWLKPHRVLVPTVSVFSHMVN